MNAWETVKETLPKIASRLSRVELRCQDAVEVIREFDGPDTLFYLDPPYLPETRSALGTYTYEMTIAQHRELIETITACRGMVVLSGYANQLYDQALASWRRVEFNMPNHSGQNRKKQRRIEIVWLSPNCRE